MDGIALAGVIIILGAGLVLGIKGRKRYICPQCKKEFSHSPLAHMLVPHQTDSRLIVCPYCGFSDYMLPEEKDK